MQVQNVLRILEKACSGGQCVVSEKVCSAVSVLFLRRYTVAVSVLFLRRHAVAVSVLFLLEMVRAEATVYSPITPKARVITQAIPEKAETMLFPHMLS